MRGAPGCARCLLRTPCLQPLMPACCGMRFDAPTCKPPLPVLQLLDLGLIEAGPAADQLKVGRGADQMAGAECPGAHASRYAGDAACTVRFATLYCVPIKLDKCCLPSFPPLLPALTAGHCFCRPCLCCRWTAARACWPAASSPIPSATPSPSTSQVMDDMMHSCGDLAESSVNSLSSILAASFSLGQMVRIHES